MINSKNNLPVVCLFLEHNMKKKTKHYLPISCTSVCSKIPKNTLRNSKLNDYQYR